jgi:tetrapyrrole methylase family protein / MazG family protein
LKTNKKNQVYTLKDLLKIMEELRRKCPWDKKQTHKSLIKYLREESKEVIDNIKSGLLEHDLKDELGDLLLQVIFHAQIAKEENRFDMNDVIDNLSRKLIRRHPHVFGKEKIKNIQELRIMWDKIKQSEKKNLNKN